MPAICFFFIFNGFRWCTGESNDEALDEEDEREEEEEEYEDEEEEQEKNEALAAYENVGWAWCFKSPSRRNFLRHFLETGAVMDTSLKSYPQIRVKMDFLDMSLDSTTGLCAVMSRLRN